MKQLTCIECQQTRIRCIHGVQHTSSSQTSDAAEAATASLEEHHVIGKLQNFPMNKSTLLREHQGNPVIKV